MSSNGRTISLPWPGAGREGTIKDLLPSFIIQKLFSLHWPVFPGLSAVGNRTPSPAKCFIHSLEEEVASTLWLGGLLVLVDDGSSLALAVTVATGIPLPSQCCVTTDASRPSAPLTGTADSF